MTLRLLASTSSCRCILLGSRSASRSACGGDTDCTAGQAGAIAGVLVGTAGISAAWREPLGDKMQSWVAGMEELTLDELVARTRRWGAPLVKS